MFLYRLPLVLLVGAFLLCFAGELGAVARNPPPVFETDYVLPPTETPAPSCPVAAENMLTVGCYALFLLIAGLAVHYWRSRKVVFCLAIGSIALFGFLWQGCPCPVGMLQNLVLAASVPSAVVSWTAVLLFLMPLFAALFWGRIFCSSVCPLGAVQELTTIKNLKISERAEHVLGLFRYFWLGIGVFCVMVGLGFVLCKFDPFVGFFRQSGLHSVMIFGIAVLVFGFFVGRPFCRFLCPYGALLGICGSLAARKVSITPGQCDQCKLCEHVCPYNAILPPTTPPTPQEKRYGPLKLAGTILALPLLVLVFALLGNAVAPRLTTLSQDIRTAQLLHAEEEKWVETSGTFPETRGLIQCGIPADEVYQKARETHRLFLLAGTGLGAWIGFVVGMKWVMLSLRHRRTDYEVDPARCFACGRCFWYCPNQKEQRLLLLDKDTIERGGTFKR